MQQEFVQQHKPIGQKLPQGKMVVTQTAAFDTIAAYAEGRVINCKTHQPVAGARIRISYDGGNAVGTAISAKNGRFRVGWVSVGNKRPVCVEAVKFYTLENKGTSIRDGYDNFLRVELMPLPK